MIGALSSSTQVPQVTQVPATPAPKPSKTASQSSARTDSVQLSATAQARLAAMHEARKTPAQTTAEANQRDRHATRPSSR